MAILAEAGRALGANCMAVAFYVLVSVGTGAVVDLCDTLTADGLFFTVSAAVQRGCQFLTDVFWAVGAACAAAVAFSRIGRDIDRPLWKVPSDQEALRRFFTLWFVLALLQLTVLRLLPLTSDAQLPGQSLGQIFLLIAVFSTPVGACNMFPGEFRWERFVHNLAPFLARLSNTFAVLLVSFAAVFASVELTAWVANRAAHGSAAWPQMAVSAISCVADSYVFAAAWLMCMSHRRETEESQGYTDYDF